METLGNSANFVPLADLHSFSDHLTFDEVTKRLREFNKGVFLLESDQGRSKYVMTTELAEIVVDLARTNAALSFGDMPLAELLQTPGTQRAVIPLGSKPYKIETDPRLVTLDNPGFVVAVTKDDLTVGVFFTDKDVQKSLNSPPPEYICNPNGHSNTTFGDGTCAYCPGTLTTAR